MRIAMKWDPTRRQFVRSGMALSIWALAPKRLRGDSSTAKRMVVRTDSPIGIVRPEFHSQFAEHLGSCVYGGLWVGKKSPIANIDGYRKQAVEYLQALGVPVLRWPGGCFADDYHWRDGVGPAQNRPKRVNIHWGGYVEDNSFGTHEFIGLCRLIGAEPYFAGNVGSGSPHELEEWIEYCNMPAGSTLAEERAKNGSPEPFRVRYWGIGNESWGCGGDMRPDYYASLFRRFAVYVQPYGGTRPFMIASGPSGNDRNWTRGLLDGLGRHLPNGLSMHYYENGDDPPAEYTAANCDAQLSIFPRLEKAITDQRTLVDGYRDGNTVGLILDEWGVWDKIPQQDEKRYGRLWQQSTMRSGVAAGLGLNIFNRQADKLYMCNIAQIVNVLQSMLLTDGPEGRNCIRTANYYAFLLFKPHRGKTALRVEADDSSALAPSVSASVKGQQMVLSFVNPKHDTDVQIDCLLQGAKAKAGKAQILQDADWNAHNSFAHPNRLVPRSHPVSVEGSRVQMDLPRLGVATVVLELA